MPLVRLSIPLFQRGIQGDYLGYSPKCDEILTFTAAIDPGNSGGLLVTRDGVLVGITNAALVQTSTDPDVEGLYYAISINSAMPTIQSLISQLPWARRQHLLFVSSQACWLAAPCYHGKRNHTPCGILLRLV